MAKTLLYFKDRKKNGLTNIKFFEAIEIIFLTFLLTVTEKNYPIGGKEPKL